MAIGRPGLGWLYLTQPTIRELHTPELRKLYRRYQALRSIHAAWRRFELARSGSSAVEFSIILPFFLVLMLGILAYGIYFGAAHSVAQLAADGARASVAGLTDAERTTIAIQTIEATAKRYPLLAQGDVSIQAGALASDPTEFLVTVKYNADNLPIWGLVNFLPLPAQMIVRTSVVKRGGY